jgi:class 3 adenylate cyclase
VSQRIFPNICKALHLTVFFILSISICSTANDTDSLKAVLTKEIPDSVRVKTLNALSKCYFNSDPDTAIIILGSSKQLAEKIDFKSGLALALKNTGIAYYLQSKYKEAVLNWQEAMKLYEELGDKVGVANMLSNQGAVFYAQGDDAKALELHLKSLKISEQINDTLRIVTSLTNIGGVYSNKEQTFKEALDYFTRSHRLALLINDDYSIGTSAVNIGEMYFKMGDNSKALSYLDEAIKYYEGTEDIPYALNAKGKVYTKQKEFEKAITTHKQAFEFSEKLDLRLDMTQSLVGLADAYFARGDISSAIETYKKALDVGTPLNAMKEMKDAYQGLTESYSKIKDYNNAYTYQSLLLTIKDSIYSATTAKKLGTLQLNFDLDKKESQISLLNKDKEIQQQEIRRQKLVRNGFIGGFGIVLLFASVFLFQKNRIAKEKKRSEELLLNILPEETAEELKRTGSAKAKSLDQVTVLFTDFKNFTQASEILTPEELVAEINHCYSEFDRIITRYGIEKIKTIGDSYMCAGGLPVPNPTNYYDVVNAALEMVDFIENNKQEKIRLGQPYFELRLGIHTGTVVAGIVGIKKFAYDIWGDTVNTASRMESSGQVGKVNISGSTFELIKDKFVCSYRGKVQAKNKGEIDMYFVDGRI